MKFKFPNSELAEGFAIGLADPDGLDVYATREGVVLEVLGLDDHAWMRTEITNSALELGATEIKATE